MFNTDWQWINPKTKTSGNNLHNPNFISIKKLKACIEIKFHKNALLKYGIHQKTKIGIAMNKDNTAMAIKVDEPNGYTVGKVGNLATALQIKIANSKISIPKLKDNRLYIQEDKIYKQDGLLIIGFKNIRN